MRVTGLSRRRSNMAFAPRMVVLLRAVSLLLLLGYGSRAAGQLVGCPFIAPLSSYSPSVSSKGSSLVTSVVSTILETTVLDFIANNSSPLYAVSVVHENQTVFTSGLATTPFMIGSVTKTFTALGALILRERGLLSLDDPVKKFLPDFTIINPYDPHDITLRELMGHVSGLPRELCAAQIVTGQSEEQCPVEESDVLEALANMELVRPPWSREPAYSNLGFGLLGHSWEKATYPPKSWEEFLEEEIFKPLELNSTGVYSTNVTLADNSSSADFDIGFVGPAGNVYSTVSDLAKYLIFLLKASPPLISASSIREWTHSRTIFPDGNGGFALPWELIKINATGGEFLITKDGSIGNFRSFVAIHEPTQLGVSAVLVRTESAPQFPDALALELLNYLIPVVETASADVIDAVYTGNYVCNASAPIFSQPLNATAETLGGYVNITGSPSLGLSALVNVSLLIEGSPGSIVEQLGMLLKNDTGNSFWLGRSDSCLPFFGGISSYPSFIDPNSPGSDYELEIEFDLANKTALLPVFGSVCLKQ